MPEFVYTARDRRGQLSTGRLEAESTQRAVAVLREQGLWVTDLRQQGGLRRERAPERRAAAERAEGPQVEASVRKRMFSPVSLKDLALYYRQLHTLLRAGIPFYGAFETLSNPEQTSKPELRRVLREMAGDLLAGRRLSEGMARYPWLFDRMQVRMVEAGEMGGLLVEVLDRLAAYLEREYEIRLEIKKRTLYPKLLLLALLFIPPVPILVFQGLFAYLFAIWKVVQGAVVVGIPVYLGLRYAVSTPQGREVYDQVKLAIPIIGPLVRKMAVARFARSLAALYGAGVPIASAVRMCGEACGNAVLEAASRRMSASLEGGGSLAQSLAASGFFKPMFIGMVSTGETTGNLDRMLDKASDFYENESMHAIIQLVVILGVLLLLLMAILIAIQVIGFWTGFYAGVGAAGSGMGE